MEENPEPPILKFYFIQLLNENELLNEEQLSKFGKVKLMKGTDIIGEGNIKSYVKPGEYKTAFKITLDDGKEEYKFSDFDNIAFETDIHNILIKLGLKKEGGRKKTNKRRKNKRGKSRRRK